MLLLSWFAALGLRGWNVDATENEMERESLALAAGSFSQNEEIHSEFGDFISWEKSSGQILWEQIPPGTRDFGSLSSYSDTRQVLESGHVRLRSRHDETTILICRVAKFTKGNAHVMIRARRYPKNRKEFARHLVALSSGEPPAWEGRPLPVGSDPPGFLTMPFLRVEVGQPYAAQPRPLTQPALTPP